MFSGNYMTSPLDIFIKPLGGHGGGQEARARLAAARLAEAVAEIRAASGFCPWAASG